MTIKECIDLVDNAKPNQYTTREKVMWLSFLDGTIINDVLKTHEGYDGRYDLFEGYSEDKLTTELIVPSPYDRLYPQYLKMKIDGENGEIVRYNNSAALYNTYLSEFKKWYNKTHMPISGAVMGGAKNDIGSCGCQSNADIAEKAAISAEEARQSAVRASDKAEKARVSAVRAESARVSADNTKLRVETVSNDVYRMASATREAADEVFAVADIFGEAEARRVSAEALRKQAEAQRVNAENARAKEMQELSKKVEEALSGAGGSSGGGFKKIGFTEDCDYVATAEEGLTAFRSAVEAASDGDIILVMQGVYKGLSQFDVTKYINFIGVGMPKIEFPVWISGGGVFSYESWSWETLYPNVKSCWYGFEFLNSFYVGNEFNPDGEGSAGYGVLENCTIDGDMISMRGEAKGCKIKCRSFNVGNYYGYGMGATMKNCVIDATEYIGAYDGTFDACEIYFPTVSYGTTDISNNSFSNCKIYALGTSADFNDPRYSGQTLGNSLVFANSTSHGFLVKPTAN